MDRLSRRRGRDWPARGRLFQRLEHVRVLGRMRRGVASPAKATATFTVGDAERTYILEHAIVTDFALVRAWKGDRHGNLVFHRAARNFNPLAAMAGRITIAEVEHVFDAGELDPDEIHLPGVFVQRIVALTPVRRLASPSKNALPGANDSSPVPTPGKGPVGDGP